MRNLWLSVLALACVAGTPAQSTPVQIRDSTDTTVLGDSVTPLKVLPDESEVRRIQELTYLTEQTNGISQMLVTERGSSQRMGVELR